MKRPVVIGYPRSGFSLLINIIQQIANFNNSEVLVLRRICDEISKDFATNIISTVSAYIDIEKFIFNGNFRQIIGGPKWLSEDGKKLIVRKYFGINGTGDFTINISLNSLVERYYDISHSHQGSNNYAELYGDSGVYFASIRDPLDSIISACFSINALASEYIQRQLPELDQDLIRYQLALYKLTDLRFFEALISPLVKFYSSEWRNLERFNIYKWEDIITQPEIIIVRVASQLGIDLSMSEACSAWSELKNRNLTHHHKHNYRPGHGIPFGWRNILTVDHLNIARAKGIDKLYSSLGYVVPEDNMLNETIFQKKLQAALNNNKILREYKDEMLFLYAFNKSNIDFKKFNFNQYDWKECSQLERSSCKDDSIPFLVWETVDNLTKRYNIILREYAALIDQNIKLDSFQVSRFL